MSLEYSLTRDERGAILVLSALLIGILAGIAVMYMNVGYAGVMRADMQIAADSAALAGASALCSSKKCFDDARRLSIETLARHRAQAGISGDATLTLDPNHPGSEWDFSAARNLIVRIERGWVVNGTFEAMEDTWQAVHPGIPNFIVANAVRVEIERPQTSIGRAIWGDTVYQLRTEAIALAAPEEQVCVSPFAVHVCALIDDDTGEYYGDASPAEACYGDRIFTQADRYCPGGGCNNMPSFPWNPCSAAVSSAIGVQSNFFATQPEYERWRAATCPSCPPSTGPGSYCYTRHGSPLSLTRNPEDYGWNGQQVFKSAHDHYGVVGLPGNIRDQNILASDVRNLLASGPNPCQGARIGDPFSVLQSGLTKPEDEDLIWQAISDTYDPQPDTNHPEFGATALGTIVRNFTDIGYAWPSPVEIFPDGPGGGLCNSKRLTIPGQPAGYQYAVGSTGKVTAGIDDFSKVWAVNVSVIADSDGGAGQCKGIGSSTADPEIDSGHRYIVVGHTRALIYDTDIGAAPPVAWTELSAGGVTYNIPLDGWGFQQQCNVVRGRMACERPFLPASNRSAANLARLVK